MSSGSSLVVPMVLWGKHAPTHCISTVLVTPDAQCVVTGCNDGQICIWDVMDHYQVVPRSLLFGHTAAISCLAVGSEQPDKKYVVSSSENGEMCLWDLTDGRCIENTKIDKIHSDITSCHLKSAKALRLICNGYYDEVVVMDPLSLEVMYSLVTRVESDWISACCVISPPTIQDDVFLAITNAGVVKVWTLSQPEAKNVKLEEDESKQIRCLNAQTLRCCPGNLRTVLIVCSKYWQIYDASDFALLCSEASRRGERWTGGDFLSVDRVIVWSNEGRGYLYKLPTKIKQKMKSRLPGNPKRPSFVFIRFLEDHHTPVHSLSLVVVSLVATSASPDHTDYRRQMNQTSVHAYYVLDIFIEHKPLHCSPALTHVTCSQNNKEHHLMLRGDSDGRVTVWTLPQVSEKQMTLVRQESFDRLPALSPKSSTTLQESWNTLNVPTPGILDGVCDHLYDSDETETRITATIYIPSQGKIVCGRNDGKIMIMPAIDCVKRQLLEEDAEKKKDIPSKIMIGHHGRVTCLLYPFNEATRYEPNHLLSGGADFSVILWDINLGQKIHTFTVHGGSLSQMTVPPASCNPRILSCICSVAGDHSVALLSLKERKCLLLASRHLYPVKMIKWRPLDDFMLVHTKDGVVTVWQMETGHLDRVIDGKTAEDVLNNCDENATPVEALTNPSITLVQALKRRNLATFRNLAHQKLSSVPHPNQPSAMSKSELMKPSGFPLLIQGVKTNTRDPDAHVLFFDTEALIVHLLTEEYALLSPAELEARGMNMPPEGKGQQQVMADAKDAQQKLAAPGQAYYEDVYTDFQLIQKEDCVPEEKDESEMFTLPAKIPVLKTMSTKSSSLPSNRLSSSSSSSSRHKKKSETIDEENDADLEVADLYSTSPSSHHSSLSLSHQLKRYHPIRLPHHHRHHSQLPLGLPRTQSSPNMLPICEDHFGERKHRYRRGSDHGLLAIAKEKAENVSQKIQSKMDGTDSSPSHSVPSQQTQQTGSHRSKRPDTICVSESLSMAIGELFMSCLHAWGLDPQLDEICINKLGLHKPRCPISFGLLSRGGHMSLMLPGWHRSRNATQVTGKGSPLPVRVVTDPSTASAESNRQGDETSGGDKSPKPPRPPPPRKSPSIVAKQHQAYEFSTKLRWQISSAVSTQHLLSVISVANTLMGMSRSVFLPQVHVPVRTRSQSNQGIVVYETDSQDSGSGSDDSSLNSTFQAQIKQGWSLLAALHCVLLPELVGIQNYQNPQLEMLAKRWQDRCLEIREAAQALLLAELRRINPEGRKTLLDRWAPFLPTYVDPELSLLSNTAQHEGGDFDFDEEDGVMAGESPKSLSFESRRKQATAIVMLGVIGAEFGHEMEPSRTRQQPEDTKTAKGKGSQEGFSLTNYSLARHTSKALTFLLLQPPSIKLPLHTPIRRAAIDLLGRGFTVWEPYLDVSAILLGLLELSIDSSKLIPSTTYGLPLSPAADACRSARHALSLIATARPPAFIITMAKEVARYNALAQKAQSQNTHLQNVILARASTEILHIIELLVEKIPNDVADLIIEAMDVSMFCLDANALKVKGLPDLFPAICRFSMVAYCNQTKRVWVGARNGSLAVYEMKQHSRCQMIPAHHGPITALAVNTDGKYLATYSHVDSKLKFWQTASSSIFGIGSQQTKLLRSYSVPAISVSPVSNILKLVRLVWVDKTTVVLLTVDGKDHKYSV